MNLDEIEITNYKLWKNHHQHRSPLGRTLKVDCGESMPTAPLYKGPPNKKNYIRIYSIYIYLKDFKLCNIH